MANANSTTILKDSHFEIVSLVGTLAVNGAHLHISISDPHGKTIGVSSSSNEIL
jgi:predicted DNA-binding protein with PD1-like motif